MGRILETIKRSCKRLSLSAATPRLKRKIGLVVKKSNSTTRAGAQARSKGRYMWMSDVAGDVRLSHATRLIGLRLAMHLNIRTGQCNPAMATLSAECAVSTRTVERAIRDLEQRGYVRRDSKAGRTSNHYTLSLRGKSVAIIEVANPDTRDANPDNRDGDNPDTNVVQPRHQCRTNRENRDSNIGRAAQAGAPKNSEEEIPDFMKDYPVNAPSARDGDDELEPIPF